ncbi:hypothetical protein QX201_002069 [Fusarium graminearum]
MSHQQGYGQPPQQGMVSQNDSGAFQGGRFSIAHRDTNAVLNIDLQQGTTVRSKSGAMIHMSSTVEITGKSKFSFGKLFTGGNMYESLYAGPGRVALGPTLFGDIISLHVDGNQSWTIGKDSFLASTSEVTKKRETQGLGKALFSGEDLFVFRVEGQGIMWLTSFGAVDRLDVSFCIISAIFTTNSTAATSRRATHCRQRPSRGMELQLCNRKGWRRSHERPEDRRGFGMSLYRSWFGLCTDSKYG